MSTGHAMKKLLVLVPLLALLGLAAAWTRSGTACATPSACVEEYYRALKDGDAARYLACLNDELRQRYRDRSAVSGDLRARGKDLRGWVLLGERQTGTDEVAIPVDEQFADRRRRQTFLV